MTQTVLNEIGRNIRFILHHSNYTLDNSARTARVINRPLFAAALTDPRYIQFCRMQDDKDAWERRNGPHSTPLDGSCIKGTEPAPLKTRGKTTYDESLGDLG